MGASRRLRAHQQQRFSNDGDSVKGALKLQGDKTLDQTAVNGIIGKPDAVGLAACIPEIQLKRAEKIVQF